MRDTRPRDGIRGRRIRAAAASVVAAAAGLLAGAGAHSAGAAAGGTAAPGLRADFDGDGYGDLVVGMPMADLDGVPETGGVRVVYGSPAGPHAGQLWHRGQAGVQGAHSTGGVFGYTLAAGDFDGDGYADLAIAAPNGPVAGTSSGAVHVLYGGAGGLRASGDQRWHRNSPGVNGSPGDGDNFGWSLAAGDFDGDGRDDLAIGANGVAVGGASLAGVVHVLHGSGSGLRAAGDQVWHRDRPGVDGDPEPGAQFGFRLAAGDFDGDGRDDLAAAVPLATVGGVAAAGQVHVLYGSGSGLTAAGDQVWHRAKPGIDGGLQAGMQFGYALAAGDFDGGGRDDLAVGAPTARVSGDAGAGLVHVVRGSGAGLSAAGDQVWHRDRPGVPGATGAGDGFGFSVVAGDFDGDGRDDLAAGVPFDAAGGQNQAGAVGVLYGGGGGLSAVGSQVWHRAQPGVAGEPGASDALGYVLAAPDTDGDGRADLAAGAPGDDIGGFNAAGSVNLLFGSGGGLTVAGDVLLDAGDARVGGALGDGDVFGSVLAG